MSERDSFEDLRDAWQSLDAPDPAPETVDPQTHVLLRALRSEWIKLEAPPVQIPAGLGRRNWRQRNRVALQLAAAFLLLIGGSAWLHEWSGPARDVEAPSEQARVASIDKPTPHAVTPADPQPEIPVLPAAHVRVVELAPIEDGIVMTHGKVRLVMLIPKTTFELLEGPQTTENSR